MMIVLTIGEKGEKGELLLFVAAAGRLLCFQSHAIFHERLFILFDLLVVINFHLRRFKFGNSLKNGREHTVGTQVLHHASFWVEVPT